MKTRSFYRQAPLCLMAAAIVISCTEKNPARNQIPMIKTQISELVRFYQGERNDGIDSLLTPTFHAEMGEKGRWQALMVKGEIWPLAGATRREFFYTNKQGEAELSLVYRSPDSQSDSLVPVKITLTKKKDIWLVEDVQPVEPIGL